MSESYIRERGGLIAHHERMGVDHELFVKMAEANWDEDKKQYNGIRTMARTLNVSSTTVIKHLHIYDEEIGRTRNK